MKRFCIVVLGSSSTSSLLPRLQMGRRHNVSSWRLHCPVHYSPCRSGFSSNERMLLSNALSCNFVIHQLDVSEAFLHGDFQEMLFRSSLSSSSISSANPCTVWNQRLARGLLNPQVISSLLVSPALALTLLISSKLLAMFIPISSSTSTTFLPLARVARAYSL